MPKRLTFDAIIHKIEKYNYALFNNDLMTPRLLFEDPYMFTKGPFDLEKATFKFDTRFGIDKIGLNQLEDQKY